MSFHMTKWKSKFPWYKAHTEQTTLKYPIFFSQALSQASNLSDMVAVDFYVLK